MWHVTCDTKQVVRGEHSLTCGGRWTFFEYVSFLALACGFGTDSDKWYVTGDTWNITCDTWRMTHGEGWIFSKNVPSLALMASVRQCFGDIFTKGHWLTYIIPKKGVCRTAPATPGMLKRLFL